MSSDKHNNGKRRPRDFEWIFEIVLCMTIASGAVYSVLSLNNPMIV